MAIFFKINAFFIMLSCMVVLAPYCEAISCGQVTSNLASCVNYIRNGGQVPPDCCTGMRSLTAAARTRTDRQTVCRCLVNIARAIPSINYGNVNGLPGKCRVNVPYRLSPNIDCSKVN